jgi:hydrogenase maturation factor
MQVVGIESDGLARCRDDDGTHADVMTDLVGAVSPGETLLVHAGVALARVEGAAA